ncbi:helix-turn-helix domain-containing protein [Streptomyces sp. NPDC026672]|uniref:TetR/AcrR family transcriptional regulator n=1 Tax=unclassified Streptomyces TaxID=2593676 RepID=UPI0033F01385
MATSKSTQTSQKPLRADAARNRERILDAARELFEQRGLDAPLDEVATRAGVGAATLYRRFPSRESLVEAVLLEKMELWLTATEAALENEDPWGAFCGLMDWLCATMAADRGFSDLISIRLPLSDKATHLRERGEQATALLIRRAQDAGRLRTDFVMEDVLLFLTANAGVMQVTQADAPHAWRRLLAYLLEGCRSDRTGPLPAAPTPLQMERALTGNACAKGFGAGHRN